MLDAVTMALSEAGLQTRDVDLLVWASARPENQVRPADPMAPARGVPHAGIPLQLGVVAEHGRPP